MGFFDDAVKVVTNAVMNPIPVIVGGLAGGALGGPVGNAIGIAQGAATANAEVEQKKKYEEYVQGINKAIAEIQATAPDYVALEPEWMKLTTEIMVEAFKKRYGDAIPPPEILAPMIVIEVQLRRKDLSDEQYQAELNTIHKFTVEAAVAQLVHERDDPENQNKPASPGDYLNNLFGEIFEGLTYWLKARFDSNFEGATNESGFAAKVLRGGFGVSFEDIKARGLLGGDNSYLRKIIPTWSDNGGLFGGDNSFFRKPFG